ncbi:MAG: hypothetical protein ABFE01_22065 [Phycisphaerales bacterium]|jgi:hypothetical protein
MNRGLWIAVSAVFVLGGTTANAITTLAGQAFDDNAFVDVVVVGQGGWIEPTAVIGPNIMSYAQNHPADPAAYLQAIFTDNSIVNGTGADFVLYEASGLGELDPVGEPAKITINGVTRTYPTVWTGEGGAYCAYINLDDFAVPAGDRVDTIRLWGIYSGDSGTEYMAIGALNNDVAIPAPAAIGLLGVGLVALRTIRRKAG